MFRFIEIARKWPSLMQQWELVESKLPKWHTQYEKRQLAFQIKIVSVVVLLCSLGESTDICHYHPMMDSNDLLSPWSLFLSVEHLLSTASILHYSVHCLNETHPVQSLFQAQLSQLFAVTSYSPWKAAIGKVLNVLATFIWTYMDLFVILISLGLSSRFKQLNVDLERIKGEVDTRI